MNEILIGAIATCYYVISLFFFRFWKTTHDRFFLFFMIAFFIEGTNRIWLAVFFELHEASPTYYLIKLLSHSFIIFAILDKNKQQKNKKQY